ncbi:MAG TPA: serine/threonine-protein kinase [Gemmatimonadales bacterium]|nr:serine/threonine-protein kinase [Gemmatimonadales bacterium]
MDPILEQLAPHLAGQYLVERELGRGGMGVVYLAREVRLDRLVALKVLPPHLAADPTIRERFLREARTAAQLSHPNIVPIYRAEEIGGFAFFAMAYIEGENLAERIRDRGALPPAEVVRILREAAWALAYAHARGVVHRDIKAANIMIERGTGRAVVTDFGIARDRGSASLTSPGEVLGTAYFMSPEQAGGGEIDGRTDLYSLGVAGFQALSGRLPFEGDNPNAILVAVATRPAPSLREVASHLPMALIEVIDRCLQHDPNNRYTTGEDLAAALGQALGDRAAVQDSGKHDRVIPEDQAQAIWLRAAQLQAEAAARLEQRSRDGAGLTTLTTQMPTGGYRLRDVELAAKEVGIGSEFVALALAEQPVTRPLPAMISDDRAEQLTTSLLGTSERSVSVSRIIKASPRVVLEAIGQLFPARPYHMTFTETVGGHPLDGGVLVFTVPNLMAGMGMGAASTYSSFTYMMYSIDLFQLNVTLHAVQGATPATEVTVYGDLRSGMRKNLKFDGWIAGFLALCGGAGGTVVGLAALGLGSLAVAPAVAGAGLLGGASMMGYRWLYRRGLRKAVEELEGLLAGIEGHLRSQDIFGAGAPRFPTAKS